MKNNFNSNPIIFSNQSEYVPFSSFSNENSSGTNELQDKDEDNIEEFDNIKEDLI